MFEASTTLLGLGIETISDDELYWLNVHERTD